VIPELTASLAALVTSNSAGNAATTDVDGHRSVAQNIDTPQFSDRPQIMKGGAKNSG